MGKNKVHSTLMGLLLALAGGIDTAIAQQQNTPTIGLLCITTCKNVYWNVFRDALQKAGRTEGRNIRFATYEAGGDLSKFAVGIRTLISANSDLLVVTNNHAAFAAKEQTTTIPIVVAAAHDAVGTGLVRSIARPGGNITGLDSLAPTLDGKRIQFVKEVIPGIRRLALLYNPTDKGMALHQKYAGEAAARLGIALHRIEASNVQQIDAALATIKTMRPDGVLGFSEPLLFSNQKRIVESIAGMRIPAFFEFSSFADAGALLTYGPKLGDLYERSASYVAKILDGAKPGDLPMEFPMTFELVVNIKTARALGLDIPRSILVSADKIIE